MYRVIVVDDEVWSVIGLTKILREDSERFELVYETTDSLDALERICEKRPDVVFTDVRMPEMSGLELMRAVRERGVQTQFVVISGFAEFSYVQQALQEGALDYHLKPFNRTSVVSMLDRLYERLESKKPMSDLEFYSLLRDKKDNVPDLLKSKFGHSLYKKLQLVLLIRNAGADHIHIDAGADSQCLLLKVGPRKCICIINSDEDKSDTVLACVRAQAGNIERAAISRVSDYVDTFEQLLKEAETTIQDSFVYPNEKIFCFRTPRREVLNRLEDQIEALYAQKKMSQIGKIFMNLPMIFADNDMGVDDARFFWNRVAMYSTHRLVNTNLVLDYLDVFELTERFSTLAEMGSYLAHQYLGGQHEESKTVNDKFREMLRHIDENYAEPLYLKELCNQFYINMSYCCELFQKHANMTFSQYLTHVRINKACEMMRYHHATVAEACDRVGYKDYFYFNKVFKKTMGCTPAEYRKNALKEG